MQNYSNDNRLVLTLDAGGTNFVFSAMQGNRPVVENLVLPACASDLNKSLNAVMEGFDRVRQQLSAPPAAISFAFPGPCDYFNGIVVCPGNLPAWRDVPLALMLEDRFGLPTFINNDGDLFTYGEATAGLLPEVNRMLEKAGSPRRFRNLLGITLGTGLGAGIVRNGELFTGDNSSAGEIWLVRHKTDREMNAEEGASIRGVRRAYAQHAGIAFGDAPEPKVIAAIADGSAEGNRAAAVEAFHKLGEITGDAICEANTLVDGLVVIGGGLAGAHRWFLPSLVAEMNCMYAAPDGSEFRRLIPHAFNLEDPQEREAFLRGQTKELRIGSTDRTIRFDGLARTGVGISRLGTSQATAIGSYAFALSELDKRGS